MSDDIRAPVLWRRPNAKTYSYNQVRASKKIHLIEKDDISTYIECLPGVWGQLLPAHDQLHRHQEQAGRVLWATDREDPPPRLRRDLHDTVSRIDQPIRGLHSNCWPIRGEPRPEVVTGVGNVESFLVSSRSQRMREVNSASGELNVDTQATISVL